MKCHSDVGTACVSLNIKLTSTQHFFRYKIYTNLQSPEKRQYKHCSVLLLACCKTKRCKTFNNLDLHNNTPKQNAETKCFCKTWNNFCSLVCSTSMYDLFHLCRHSLYDWWKKLNIWIGRHRITFKRPSTLSIFFYYYYHNPWPS